MFFFQRKTSHRFYIDVTLSLVKNEIIKFPEKHAERIVCSQILHFALDKR